MKSVEPMTADGLGKGNSFVRSAGCSLPAYSKNSTTIGGAKLPSRYSPNGRLN